MNAKVKILEYVEDTVIIQLPIEGFDELSLNDKLVAYHLWNASVAGDPISYLQNYQYGLAIRDVFLNLLKYHDLIRSTVYEKIETYAKKILINHGHHDGWSTRKFLPTFTKEELHEALDIVKANGHVIQYDDILDKAIFDPHFEVMLTQKSPPHGQDIITASHNTFYEGVTLKDLEHFKDQNPNNSTVVKEHGKIVEHIWRTGTRDGRIPPGMYAEYLRNVIMHLKEACDHAKDDQAKNIRTLIRYFEEGTASLWDDYNIEWLKINPTVDTIFGFVEEYRDTRGMKGLFEGMVYFKDKETNVVIKKIADECQHLENHAPWIDAYKKQWTSIPVSNAITLLLGTGGAGPICWAGVNLPNAQDIREKHGSKNAVVTNVTYASRNAFAEITYNEFLDKKEDIDMAKKYLGIRGPIMVTLHEVVGHGSGKINPTLKGDPRDYLCEYYSTLEEARAELCALHHIWDPKLREIGVIPNEECCKSAYLLYALQDITQLRMLKEDTEIHEDHLRATHLIIQYLMHAKKCVELAKHNGKTYPRVIDYTQMRAGVAELLAEIMRIKAEGDYAAAKKLVETYAVQFDHALRDEMVARCAQINYPSSYAYVMPRPEIVLDDEGKAKDVVLKYPSSILDQGVLWRNISS